MRWHPNDYNCVNDSLLFRRRKIAKEKKLSAQCKQNILSNKTPLHILEKDLKHMFFVTIDLQQLFCYLLSYFLNERHCRDYNLDIIWTFQLEIINFGRCIRWCFISLALNENEEVLHKFPGKSSHRKCKLTIFSRENSYKSHDNYYQPLTKYDM